MVNTLQPRYTLAADVGGTKTLFELGLAAEDRYRTLHVGHFFNADFRGVAEVAEAFLATAPQRPASIAAACFALAGPIVDQRVRLTNLPWEADAGALGQRLGIGRVAFVNDFAAIGHGIPSLASEELLCLQAGSPEPHGVRGVLGAGTGLGMVFMVWTGKGYQVVPSEGGKADFAPVNEVQNRLWTYLRHRLERVGCESLLSGRGMERIYEFLSEADTLRMRSFGGRPAEAALPAAEITTGALEGTDPRAVSTINLFLEIYGAVAGNFALTLLSSGGLYIAGGIAPRLASFFADSGFMQAFCAKGKFADLMRTIPVQLVLSPDVGLRGAVAIASGMTVDE
jgi:glucokinase